MNKFCKILSCIQILVMICLMVCTAGIRTDFSQRPGAYPCKKHQCGCKSETDCKTHCCCALQKNSYRTQENNNEQRSSLQVFISSVDCRYGNDPMTIIAFAAEYIVEGNAQPAKELFLYFLRDTISIYSPEVCILPPEKPPRSLISV